MCVEELAKLHELPIYLARYHVLVLAQEKTLVSVRQERHDGSFVRFYALA